MFFIIKISFLGFVFMFLVLDFIFVSGVNIHTGEEVAVKLVLILFRDDAFDVKLLG